MGRKKINIREIENSRQKTVTFARRRAGLIKKAHELSILCGVKVAVVIFDSKNASHVYSSADTPEELFTRYLNKQFLTNESRKRKDTLDSSSDTSGGTYGFDNNGSFVRRRLAVVNEYKVTSDGPNSRNLHVKYTKQYHNPSSAAASQRQSMGSASTLSTSTLEQALHSSPSVLSSLNDSAQINDVAGLHGQAALSRQMVCGLPARTISLLKNSDGMAAGSEPMPAVGLPFQASEFSYPPFHMGLGAEQPNARNADGLKNATRDLSALSLFSDSNGQINGGAGITSGVQLGIDGLFSPFGSSGQRESNSPLSSSDGGSSYSNSHCEMPKSAQNEAEHRAKRPRSQVYDSANGDDAKYSLDKTLVEDFLSNSKVAELLSTSWRPTNKEEPSAEAAFESDSNHDEDEDESSSDEESDDEEEEDEVADDSEGPQPDKPEDGAQEPTIEPQMLPSLEANASILRTLQSLGMTAPTEYSSMGAGSLERDASLQQLFSGQEQAPAGRTSSMAFGLGYPASAAAAAAAAAAANMQGSGHSRHPAAQQQQYSFPAGIMLTGALNDRVF
ncbi:hypothetical protein IWW36_001773 [Coemansia brasiliensis]|uniref:MADS-box domain-containing protein n=1 Tax=Coemansia brasiliensis TaxID=2650707 RepID=A0A9W8M0J0_9FUNG|nr:hypothetical protein IWW36_001773 [Coemansia brasiliensis]